MTKTEIEYTDVTKLSKNMQRAADYTPRIVDNWLHKMVGPALVTEMQTRAPVSSGHLKDSIRQMNEPRRVTVGPFGVTYNQFVVDGSKPHVIRPKKGKYLAFKNKAGKMVYVREVHHPGTKPNPYMRDSAQAVMRRMTPQLTRLTINVLRTGNVD